MRTEQDMDYEIIRTKRKTVAISDCEPDVTVLEPLLVDKAKKVMV